MAKKQFNARLTDAAIGIINALAEHLSTIGAQTTQADVVELAVKRLAQAEKVTPKPKHYPK